MAQRREGKPLLHKHTMPDPSAIHKSKSRLEPDVDSQKELSVHTTSKLGGRTSAGTLRTQTSHVSFPLRTFPGTFENVCWASLLRPRAQGTLRSSLILTLFFSCHDLIDIPSKIVHPTLPGCVSSCFGLCPIQVFFSLTQAVLPVIFETPRLRLPCSPTLCQQ